MPPRSTTNGKKRSRPSGPPPPPPEALVALLRSDSTVLEYFTSLQTSLDADVEQWKSRAQRYKEECNQLKRRLRNDERKSTPTPFRHAKQTTNKASIEPEQTFDDKQQESKRTNGKRPAVVANEHVFALSSDDDDDDDAFMVEQKVASVTSPMMEKDEEVTDWTTYSLLLEACNSLRQLGVALVAEEVAQTKEQQDGSPNDQSDADDDDDDEVPITYIRRCDHDIAVDMMHAAHTLTRIQMQMKDSTMYLPFSSDTFLPCCNAESHPAAQGKECILQALSVMDVYCTSMNDSQWNKLFPPESADDAIRVGMRDRHDLVNMLLSSLLGETSDTWAVSERSSRLISKALHYESTSDEDEVLPFAGNFGAKSLVRLSNLAEKCLLAQVVSSILYQRDEHQEMTTLIFNYILSAALSFGVEDYPRLQPVLSLCVIESMLYPYLPSNHAHVLTQLHPFCPCHDANVTLCMRRGIGLALRAAIGMWTARLVSPDERISDISRVELACYNRLSQTQVSWLANQNDTNDIDSFCNEARTLLSEALNDEIHTSTERVDVSIATQISLITLGDLDTLMGTFEQAVKTYSPENSWILIACCSAFRELQIRQIDSFRAKQGSLVVASSSEAMPVVSQILRLIGTLIEDREPSSHLVDTVIKCCRLLSAGEQILEMMLWLATSKVPQSDRNQITTIISKSIGTPLTRMDAPLVRIINLKRRADRIIAFMAQAQSEGILVAKAVAKLDIDDERCALVPFTSNDFDTDYIWGMHAFDGQGAIVEVTNRLSDVLGNSRDLNSLVESQWRPNDLKAFDKDARNDDKLVDLSLSECACALSHIASWKGVYRSLTTCRPSKDCPLEGLPFPFVISGYARGKPLLYSNESMPPTPVCVILEDDAILVDRFADRLSALLEELPRDFHFCSIGYSRPKTAPIAKYGTHVGIPSCIWYLTGYILSLEGAKYLIDSLPVRGPVDSWIGLKMCSNWDNVFGQAMGVGARASSVSVELPSRKDLAHILKFRAFAALVPLCSQKVDTSTNTTVGRSWRQRDTDVTYSGNL